MKKNETQKFIKNITKEDKKNKKKIDIKWIIIITLLAFAISLLFSFLSETFMPNVNIIIALILVLAFIIIGVVFDMIGVAITSGEVAPFHSMSAKKIRGANVAVSFKKKADKMSSFCNDVIGDICGIISGSAGIYLANKIAALTNIDIFIMTLIVTSLIAAFTIGGKAIGKGFAINNSTTILYKFSKFISYFKSNK